MINYFVYKTILPGTAFNISNLDLVSHVQCDFSSFPWDWGWCGWDSGFWMLHFFKKVLTAPLNSVPLSHYTLVGGPNVLLEKKSSGHNDKDMFQVSFNYKDLGLW